MSSSQTEITSTRNGRVITQQVSGTRQSQRRGERLNVGQIDTQAPDIPVDTTPPVVEITPPTVVDVVPPTIFVPPVIPTPLPIAPRTHLHYLYLSLK